jgi:PAS domain S-box-containing protein
MDRFRHILELANEGIWTLNADNRTDFINAYGASLIGYRPEEMVGMPVSNFLFPELGHDADTVLSRIMSGEEVSFEFQTRHRDGSIIWIDVSITALFSNGRYDGAVAVFSDITERKLAEEERRFNDIRNYALFNLTQLSGVTPKDIAERAMEISIELTGSKIGYITFVNEDETELTVQHYSKSAMEACLVQNRPFVFHIESSGLWGEAVRQRKAIITNDYAANNPLKRGYPPGHVPIVRHLNVPLFDRGKIVAVIGVGNKETDYDQRDVKELSLIMYGMWRIVRKMEAEDELRRSNDELKLFADVASHDLQEPLRMVTLYIDLINKKHANELSPQVKEYMQFAVEGSMRMKDLIDDLLNYSHIGSNPIERSDVDMNEVAKAMSEELRVTINEAGAKLIINSLPTIHADGKQMKQLLMNLVSNAIKFHGGEPPRVEVSAANHGNNYVFSVSDNGIGIDPKYEEFLFKMFQRLHPRDEYPGTGIGLAISKKIIDRHGGKIWFESEPGKGSTFYFTLPRYYGP